MTRRILTAREQHQMLAPWRKHADRVDFRWERDGGGDWILVTRNPDGNPVAIPFGRAPNVRTSMRRTAMAYWFPQDGAPVHHLPAAEVNGYQVIHPLREPIDPDSGWHKETIDLANGGQITRPDWGDEDYTAHDLRDDIKGRGIQSPVEIITNGQTAFLSDGNHRSAISHELGEPTIPTHIVHLHDEDYAKNSEYAWSGPFPVGPALRSRLEFIPKIHDYDDDDALLDGQHTASWRDSR